MTKQTFGGTCINMYIHMLVVQLHVPSFLSTVHIVGKEIKMTDGD